MTDIIIIDNETYDVPIISMKRAADQLYKYAERTADGKLHAEMIGVYYNYEVVFGKNSNPAAYALLFDKLSEPVVFHTVTLPTESGTRTFSAYFAGVTDVFIYVKETNRVMQGLSVNVIARDPARIPT